MSPKRTAAGKKVCGPDQPGVGGQSQQRLVVRDVAALDVQQRLVVEHERVLLERLADAAHPADVLRHLLALLAGHAVELDAIAAGRLGRLARDVRLRDELMGAEASAADRSHADTALEVEHLPLLHVLAGCA